MDTLIGFGIVGGILWAIGYAIYRLHRSGQWVGARKAYAEITRGIGHHCDTTDGKVPENLGAAIYNAKTARDLEDLLAKLWTVGDELGNASWSKGYTYGIDMSQSKAGIVQLELTQQEVLELRWAAHIGFQYAMMPTTWETHQYKTEREAQDATSVIEKLERKIPKEPDDDDPYAQSFNRQNSIWRKWPSANKSEA